jgi:hypothetical protein
MKEKMREKTMTNHLVDTSRSDLRDARCTECGARCVPGQSHAEHNAGWNKKLLMWDWHEVQLDGYPGWDLVDPGSGHGKHPPFIKLAICNKIDKSSEDISREFDDVATGRFYSRDWSRNGSCGVGEGEFYDAGWWFQKREDAYEFIRLYGGIAG